MKTRRLSNRTIETLKPARKGARYDLMDATVPGFGVRVNDKGKGVYVLLARYPGSTNPTRRALAQVGALTLADAREKAQDWHKLLKAGKDPAVEEERQRLAEARRQSNSFATMAEDYIRLAAVGADPKKPKQRKGPEVARDLRREFIARWAKKPVTDITPQDVTAVLDDVIARGADYQAHNLLGHVRRLFNWAIARGTYGLESSPCDRMKPRDVIGPKALRNRVLDQGEIIACWRASRRLGYPFGPLFRLLILTGQRKSEVGEARWREFHPELVRMFRDRKPDNAPIKWSTLPKEWRVWTIGADRMKANAAHIVPLTDDALEILATVPHFGKGDFLFTTTFGAKPVNGFSKAKNRLDREMLRTLEAMARKRGDNPDRSALTPFVLHDLRRTMRTGLSALPIPDLVRELVIAHTKPGLHKVYDQHAYLDEKRQALELWAARLREMLQTTPANVVKLAKVRG